MTPPTFTEHQDAPAQVDLPLPWLALATVHFNHAFWIAVALAVANFFIRSPNPWVITGLIVLGLLGLTELATAFYIGRVGGPRIVAINALFIPHPPPPFFRWLRGLTGSISHATMIGFCVALLVSFSIRLYAVDMFGAPRLHFFIDALTVLWFGVAFAAFVISASVQEKFVRIVPRSVVINLIRNAKDQVYFFGNPDLLVQPPSGIDVRGVFDSGPSSLDTARFIRAETSPKFVIVDGATYHFYTPEQPLFAQLRNTEVFTKVFLNKWQQGDADPQT